MNWNIEGAHVAGLYLNSIPFSGIVIESRVKHGATVQHTVKLDTPVKRRWSSEDREYLLISNDKDTFEIQ